MPGGRCAAGTAVGPGLPGGSPERGRGSPAVRRRWARQRGAGRVRVRCSHAVLCTGLRGLSNLPGWPLKREGKVASPQFVLPGTGPGQRCGAVVGDAVTSFPRRSSLSQSVVTTALSQASALGLCSAASCWLCEEWVSSGKYPSRKSCD